MKHMDISKLDKTQLKDLLGSLKLYRDLWKQLGRRWTDLFKRNLSGTHQLVVEYFPSMSQQIVFDSAKGVYKKIFNLEVSQDDIVFIQKQSLLGGMKVYKNDSMVDMSFSHIEWQLRK